MERIQDLKLFAAIHGHSPNARTGLLAVVNVFTIHRFEGQPTSLPGHLYRLASLGGHSPHLVNTGTVGRKIYPLPIPRPTRHSVVEITHSNTAGLATFRADYEDMASALFEKIEGDLLTVGRPARGAGIFIKRRYPHEV